MIVTFHIAVHLAYCILENIKSILFQTYDQNFNDLNNDQSPETETNQLNSTNVNHENEGSSPTIETLHGPNIFSELRPVSSESKSTSRNHYTEDEEPETPNVTEDELPVNETLSSSFLSEEHDFQKQIYDIPPIFTCTGEGSMLTFIPPVYTQRYMHVEKILKEPCWANTVKKVVDFGCSELKFESSYLKKLEGINEIVAVDIDEDLLNYNQCRLMPLITEYLERSRSSPLKVRIYCGSVAETNEALVGCDAVVAIELIEHLFPPELEDLPFTIFGFIQPKIAIFTTPNADFNELFTNLSGFRHDDHKFEWTRQEFEDWANNLVQRYPDYSVTFQGIGPGPTGTEHLGCCSQMAVFVKLYDSHSIREDELHIQDGHYKLIKEYDFPYDERTRDERLRDDAISFIYKQISLKRHYKYEIETKEIPLKNVMKAIRCWSREKLIRILEETSWKIGKDKNGYEVIIVSEDEEEDEQSSNISDSYSEQEYGEQNVACDSPLECWDDECGTGLVNCQDESNDNTCDDSLLFDSQTVQTNNKNDFTPSKISEDSIYETPFTNRHNGFISQCENLSNNVKDCNKALDFETTYICDGNSTNNSLVDSNEENDRDEMCCCLTNVNIVSDESEPFCSVDGVSSSSLNTSIYATPCCSKEHKNQLPKCLSMQLIKSECSLPVSSVPPSCEQIDGIGKSTKGFITHESCSDVSKIADSGYPDSPSEKDMDNDSTLKQFDEIESESEGNYELQVQQVICHGKNGDRDGNNVVDMEEECFDFEAQIEDVDKEVDNFAKAVRLEIQQIVQYGSPSIGERSMDMEEDDFEFEARIEVTNNEVPCVAEDDQLVPIVAEDRLKDKVENNSEIEAQIIDTNCSVIGVEEDSKQFDECNIKSLDESPLVKKGHFQAEFHDKVPSGSSMLMPLAQSRNTSRSNSPKENSSSQCLIDKPMLDYNCEASNRLCYLDNTEGCKDLNKNGINEDSCQLSNCRSFPPILGGSSTNSECSSSQPLYNTSQIVHQTDQSNLVPLHDNDSLETIVDDSAFPSWLLNIQSVSESEEDSLENRASESSVRYIDSFEDFQQYNYDEQGVIDSGAGGDQILRY